MTAFLPQQEPFLSKTARALLLRGTRALFEYDYTHVAPLAIVKDVPITQEFSFEWLGIVAQRVIDALENRAQLELGSNGKLQIEQHRKTLKSLLSIGRNSILDIKRLVTDALRLDGRFGAPARHATTLKEYAELFREFGLPPIAKDFQEDRTFAAMRTAGPNPVMLQRINSLDSRLPFTAAMYQEVVPNDSLDAALAEGRLYLADYAMLDGAELSSFPNGQKYLYAPLALFALTGPRRELTPVAIQCRQKPAPDNPIFTPRDGYNWLIAKTIVETADGNYHEAATHLGRTHLAMEPFVVSTYRQLAANHPLALLLRPHFEGTLAINRAAWQHLIADKGAVDKLMGGSIKTSRGVAAQGVRSLRVMNELPPLTFARRGTSDRDAFPVYPYRDDSLLYWDAIREWVDSYLRIYYPTESLIQLDVELQAWVRELASTDGGRLQGLPNNGVIRRIDELIDLTSYVIFTSSVQHAAVNFPQYDLMSYVPNMPLANYRPAPTTKTGATEADWIAMLPTLDMAELQMELGCLLGTVHYTQLGRYEKDQFEDPRAAAPLARFQQKLAEIGTTIARRNTTRRPYATLAPEGVPQSINI